MAIGKLRVFPPFSMADVLRPMAQFDAAAFEKFSQAIASKLAFTTDKKRCEKLAGEVGARSDDVAVLLSLLSSLYDRLRDLEESNSENANIGSDFIDELLSAESAEDDDADGLKSDEVAILKVRLPVVLLKNPNVKEAEKVSRLKFGFLKNAIGFSSFVDMRPNFTDGYSSFKGIVPVTQIRIATDADNPSDREFIFQCNRDALHKLKKVVADAELKLDSLANHPELSKYFEAQDE